MAEEMQDWQRRPLPQEISQRLLELERNQVEFQEALDKFFPNGNFSGEAVRKALHSKNVVSSLMARGIIDLYREMTENMIEIAQATVAHTNWDKGEMLNAAKSISRCVSGGALEGQAGTQLASHLIWPRNRLSHQRYQLLAESPERLDKALEMVNATTQGFVQSYQQWIEQTISPEKPRPELSDLEPQVRQPAAQRKVVIDEGLQHATPQGRERRPNASQVAG